MNHGIIEELSKALLKSEARHYQSVNQGIIEEIIKALWKGESRHYWRVGQIQGIEYLIKALNSESRHWTVNQSIIEDIKESIKALMTI